MDESDVEDTVPDKAIPESSSNNALRVPVFLYFLFWMVLYIICFLVLGYFAWSFIYNASQRKQSIISAKEMLNEKCFFIMTAEYHIYVNERHYENTKQTKFFQHYDYHLYNRSIYYKIDPQFILGIFYTIATIILTFRFSITLINGYYMNTYVFWFDFYLVGCLMIIIYKGFSLAVFAIFFFDDYCYKPFWKVQSFSSF